MALILWTIGEIFPPGSQFFALFPWLMPLSLPNDFAKHEFWGGLLSRCSDQQRILVECLKVFLSDSLGRAVIVGLSITVYACFPYRSILEHLLVIS